MSEFDQNQQFYPSPSKLPSLRDLQSRQKQFNKLSAQRLSIQKQPEIQQQQQQQDLLVQQQQPSSQLSGKKYYQSRYIHSPGQSLNYQRSGSKAQERIIDADLSIQQTPQQTPISQFSAHNRNKSEYQLQQQSWELDPGLVDDQQIEQFVEQLLLDDMVAQQLREQRNIKDIQIGKNVKELVLRLTNQIMMNQGLRQQQSAAFQNQYNTLKSDYLKLQSDYSRRVAEQHDRIQRLENDCKEKDELIIREQKTRQMLENQNMENTKRLSEVTGEYHSKLQMKEDIFYQKGQECYNEINVLRQLVGELQEKVQQKEQEIITLDDSLQRSTEKLKIIETERNLERSALQNDIYQYRDRCDQMQNDEKELTLLIEQLKGELQILEGQCAERENLIRVNDEEKKRDNESYELMLKEKDQQRAFEVNNLLQLVDIDRNKHSELREKYLMKIGLIEDEVKNFLVFKQDVVSWIYQQKTQILQQFKQILQKSNETITKNANWYKKLLKERDNEYNQLVQQSEKEVNELNERWQEMMQQQEMQLKNEHRSELLLETGKLEAQIITLQGQIMNYETNYLRVKEHNEILLLEITEHKEDNDNYKKQISELDTNLIDCEWKYQKEIDENKLISSELLELQQKQEISQKLLNETEKQRLLAEQNLKVALYKGENLEKDINNLLQELFNEKNKYEQNDKEKKTNQQTGLSQANKIIRIKEEICQREYEIKQLKSTIVSKEISLEDRCKEKEQLLQIIEELKSIINIRDERIRSMELISRDDLYNYLITNQMQSELMHGLKQKNELLIQHIDELDLAHKIQTEQKQSEKINVIEELHKVISQLNDRNNELRNEKRTVEGLLANKKKLENIIENLNTKIEELNMKQDDTQNKLKGCQESKDQLLQQFDDYKLKQLKRHKYQLVQTKKLFAQLKSSYLDHKNDLENYVDTESSLILELQQHIQSTLHKLSVEYEQQLNTLRMNLDESHTENLNQLLHQEKKRNRVQQETMKKQMGEQIVQLSEQINTLKKKLQHAGGEKQTQGQNLDASEIVKRFSTQQLQDIQSRYLSIKSELDTIISEIKGKYQTIQQLHESKLQAGSYTKEQIKGLKHFAEVQDVLEEIINKSEALLKKYIQLDAQRDRDLKASQSLMQSKIIANQFSSQKKKQQQQQQDSDIPYQLTDSFSPTQYSQRRQYETQQQQQQQSQQNFPSDQAIKMQKLDE